jgi:hypothetical protein
MENVDSFADLNGIDGAIGVFVKTGLVVQKTPETQ